MSTLTDAVAEALDRGRPTGDEGGREAIDNRERGCGHLKANACYVRSDVAALSAAGGEIPRFVELDDPVEYRENPGRGSIIPSFEHFPGNSFAAHYHADGRTTTPSDDIPDHAERLTRLGFDGDHYGDITSAHSFDLLMSVGKTNWETPDDFVEECRDRGLNLKIGASSNSPPPVIEPLRTRVWVIHPHGAGEGRPAIIGYAYLTRNVFTSGTKATDDDPDIPKWAEDYAKTRRDFDVVDRGEPIAKDDPSYDPNQTVLSEDGTGVVRPNRDSDPAKAGVDAARKALRGDDSKGGESETDDTGTPIDDDPVYDVATLAVSAEGSRDVTGLEVEFDRHDVSNTRRDASLRASIDDGPLTYNDLKIVASRRDEVDVGANPSQDDLIDALVTQAGVFVPAYDGGSNE